MGAVEGGGEQITRARYTAALKQEQRGERADTRLTCTILHGSPIEGFGFWVLGCGFTHR